MKTLLFICFASLVICFNYSFGQWEELGPANGLLPIGNTSYLHLRIDGNNIFLVEAENMYYSSDHGNNWQVTNYKSHYSPLAITIMGIKDSNVFVEEMGDYKVSRDLGKTWKIYKDGDTAHAVGCNIKFLGNLGIAGGIYALYKTTDFGETFSRIMGVGWSNDGYCPLLIQNGVIFAGTNIGNYMFKSIDSGVTWKSIIFPPIPSKGIEGEYRGYVPINNLLICFDRGSFNSAAFSTDNGDSWIIKENYPKIIPDLSITSCGNVLYGLAGGPRGFYVSKDTGRTWTPFNNGLRLNGDVEAISMQIDKEYIYLTYLGNGGGGGIYRAKLKDCEIDFSSDVKGVEDKTTELFSPNPASDFIEIQNPNYEKVIILNILGETILKETEATKIDISSFPPGLYFLRIGDKVAKFLKM